MGLLNALQRICTRTLKELTPKSPWQMAAKRVGARAVSTSMVHNNIMKCHVPDVTLPTGNVIHNVFANVNQWGSKTAV
ncbi:hypothetical protein SK128_024643, partial [Halocaridina rubra]